MAATVAVTVVTGNLVSGNVSFIDLATQEATGYTATGIRIADAAVTPLARAGLLAAAKTMALTTFDLLADPARVRAAKDEFARSR